MQSLTQQEVWERRELSRRLARPLLKRIIGARLNGKTLNTAALVRMVPALRGKRKSIQVACVGMTLARLRSQGLLPDWLEEVA